MEAAAASLGSGSDRRLAATQRCGSQLRGGVFPLSRELNILRGPQRGRKPFSCPWLATIFGEVNLFWVPNGQLRVWFLYKPPRSTFEDGPSVGVVLFRGLSPFDWWTDCFPCPFVSRACVLRHLSRTAPLGARENNVFPVGWETNHRAW